MKKVKITSLALVLILTAALLFACSGGGSGSGTGPSAGASASGSAPAGAITFTDMFDREVSLAAPATKVVAITAADCEILYALGAGDTVVGRGEYCNYPEEVLDVEAVDSGSELNVEQVIALEPEVVIMGGMAQSDEQVKALEAGGITVVVSYAQDITGTYTAIEMIGKVVGKTAEADALVAEMKQGFADIEAKVEKSDTPKTVYFEVSPLEWGLWTSGSNTFMDEIATMLGLENAFADVDGWAEISEEQVLERDPDYIVTSAMYFGEGPEPDEEILGRTGWQDLKAVKAGQVFLADNDSITRPGPRLVQAAETLYGQVYG